MFLDPSSKDTALTIEAAALEVNKFKEKITEVQLAINDYIFHIQGMVYSLFNYICFKLNEIIANFIS